MTDPDALKLTAEQFRAWEEQWEGDGYPTDWEEHQREFKRNLLLVALQRPVKPKQNYVTPRMLDRAYETIGGWVGSKLKPLEDRIAPLETDSRKRKPTVPR